MNCTTFIAILACISFTGLIGCSEEESGGGGGGGGGRYTDTGYSSGNGSNDECGGDRGSGDLGSVCREDCDCSSGYSCYTDDYAEQCCAQQLNDLENGSWGVDCDGVQ